MNTELMNVPPEAFLYAGRYYSLGQDFLNSMAEIRIETLTEDRQYNDLPLGEAGDHLVVFFNSQRVGVFCAVTKTYTEALEYIKSVVEAVEGELTENLPIIKALDRPDQYETIFPLHNEELSERLNGINPINEGVHLYVWDELTDQWYYAKNHKAFWVRLPDDLINLLISEPLQTAYKNGAFADL